MAAPTSPGPPRSCTSGTRPGPLRRSSPRSSRPASRSCEGRRPRRLARAADGRPRPTQTPRCSSPRRPASRSATSRPGGSVGRTVTLTDAGGGGGAWAVSTSSQQPAGGVSFSARRSRRAGRARRDGSQPRAPRRAAAPGSSCSRAAAIADGSRTGSASRRPRSRQRRRRPHANGHVQGNTRGNRARRVVPLSRGPRGSAFPRTLRGPEQVFRVSLSKPVANFGVAVTAGDSTSSRASSAPATRTGCWRDRAPVQRESLPARLRQADARRRSRAPAPGDYDIVFDTLNASARRAVHVPLLDRRHDPPAAAVLSARRRRPRLARDGAGIDPSQIRLFVDGLQRSVATTRAI